MAKMVEISVAKKNSLIGKKYDGETYFYPVQHENGKWYIGELEAKDCTLKDHQDLKQKSTVDSYVPMIKE